MRPVAAAALALGLACLAARAGALRVSGNQLLSDSGSPLKLHGVNYFGFNNGQTFVDGLWAGDSSLTKDYGTQIYRMQLLGFNAVRFPFSFKDFSLPGRTDYMSCREASLDEIRRSVTPPGASPSRAMPGPRAPLTAGGGKCNIGAPSNVFDRFLWALNYAAKAGMTLVIDNHVWLEDPTAYENPQLWVDSWAKLAGAIAKDPTTRAAVMYDLVNEPDNKRIFWAARDGRPSLAKLYLDAMDAITKAHPDAVFVLEGTGQIGYGIPSGDGFVTDPAVIKGFAGKKACTTRYCLDGIEDPNFFFQQLMARPYAQNIVWGPHWYAQSVIPFPIPKAYMDPPGMFKRLADSFGYLSKKGYCAAGKCLKWPVLLGEFSAPHAGAPGDYAAAAGLVQFINSEPINLWFYWCWNDNSPDTNGGIVSGADKWKDIDWNKIKWLQQIGLKPWYA